MRARISGPPMPSAKKGMLWLLGIHRARGSPESTTRKRRRKRARWSAAVSPAGPPPTTSASSGAPAMVSVRGSIAGQTRLARGGWLARARRGC